MCPYQRKRGPGPFTPSEAREGRERERERERETSRTRKKQVYNGAFLNFGISAESRCWEWTGFEYVFPWVGLDPPFSLVLLSCVFPPKIPRVSIFDLAPCGSGILSRFAYESFFAIAEFCKHAGFCRCISESPYNSTDYVIHLDGFQYLFSTSVLNRVI